ncbi:MAG: PQQ-dependent sugar dehydrogenase [Caulobacteraceae bacterium]|nr:PQQ-dependent sugar dehydrogenase [Caulobacteraceae bacterium]
MSATPMRLCVSLHVHLCVQGQPETVLQFALHHEVDNGHWTRNLIANTDGAKIYLRRQLIEHRRLRHRRREEGRAAIWEYDVATNQSRIFASGLRNPVGMSWGANDGCALGRCERTRQLGDTVPDYITHVQDGAFYGWPYYYWGASRRACRNPRQCTSPIANGSRLRTGRSHRVAWAFGSGGTTLPEQYRSGAFIGLHGSWNRSELVGYRVAYVPFSQRPAVRRSGRLRGLASDFRQQSPGSPSRRGHRDRNRRHPRRR